MPDNTFRNLVRLHARQTRVGKFGQFQFSIFHPGGPDADADENGRGLALAANKPNGGDFVAFDFTIQGTAPFAATDFTSVLSENSPGRTPSRAAAKFVNGPNDDSAFGATQTDPVGDAISLSEQSSDSTPAGDLQGTISFVVEERLPTFPGSWELRVFVTADGDFNINEIYFNATDKVTGLTGFGILVGGGWDFAESL